MIKKKIPAIFLLKYATSSDIFQAAIKFQPFLFYTSAAPNDIKDFWTYFHW